jgi:hypothetical protein
MLLSTVSLSFFLGLGSWHELVVNNQIPLLSNWVEGSLKLFPFTNETGVSIIGRILLCSSLY